MRWRTQTKMPRDQRRLDFCAMQFPTNAPRRWTCPDRVFDVYDRRHQTDKTKIAFNCRNQGADPRTVTGREYAELTAAMLTQRAHQLAQFDHALTQSFCVTNQIARDRQFTVPIPARGARKMIGQM